MNVNPFMCSDGYKTSHYLQYPEGTTLVYSNFTPRSAQYAPKGCEKVVSFGQQMVVQQIKELFDNEFFAKPKDEVCGEVKREYDLYLNTDYDVSHIERLHDLGYLPIKFKSLDEGTLVPIGIPVLTVVNTDPDFFWLTNFLETLISNLLWKPITSATIAHQYKKNLVEWAEKTDKDNVGFVDFQGHDFSMRGLDSVEATVSSGLGHATSFLGSDSLPTIYGARTYYGEESFVVGSVNATEHSVMSAGSKEDEIGTFRRLMETFPTGILSIVSDTWDLWKVCTEYLPELKDEIMARDGKIVIRPDSGDPVDIICGINQWSKKENGSFEKSSEAEQKGVIELLWDIFGGTINTQGYKVLDPHIGAIYGDSITIERAEQICERLEDKGFASTNIVLGIGSFTYQYNTRDTFGFAMKATYCEIEETFHPGEESVEMGVRTVGHDIFKDPVTDDGTKKSAVGLLCVHKDEKNGEYKLADQVDWELEQKGWLKTIFENGQYKNQVTLTTIRERLSK